MLFGAPGAKPPSGSVEGSTATQEPDEPATKKKQSEPSSGSGQGSNSNYGRIG